VCIYEALEAAPLVGADAFVKETWNVTGRYLDTDHLDDVKEVHGFAGVIMVTKAATGQDRLAELPT